ncbi:MAG: hypothetical protein ACJAYU_000938 [Bradymonadia bacterium]|jgi:uncharacterized protein YqhQ
MAVAVRRADGRIEIRDEAWTGLNARFSFLRAPFMRGGLVLAESMHNGMSALSWAAERMEIDEVAKEAAESGKEVEVAEGTNSVSMAGTMAFSLALAFGLFIALPHGLALLGGKVLGIEALNGTTPLFHAVAGGLKLCVLLTYLWGISRLPDVRRVFQYHGAEHKAIYTWEANEPLDIVHAQAHTRLHPRCGTSFLFIVIITSILVFTLAFSTVSLPIENRILHQLALVGLKLPLMFPIAGLAYEFQRMSAKYPDSPFVKPFIFPGLMLQHITTQEPDDEQVEVALVSLKAALAREATSTGKSRLVQDAQSTSAEPSNVVDFPAERRQRFVANVNEVEYADPRPVAQDAAE